MKLTLLVALIAQVSSLKLARDVNEQTGREFINGPEWPNDPNAADANAHMKDMWIRRNAPGIMDSLAQNGRDRVHPLIDNHPINYPYDAGVQKKIAETEDQERRFW